ncbi:hypothetical protein EST38_g4911 [Candolleomyces aberdarensis]|uniref:Uncharacterized protein n=1 Tax=Candolleomyces aberdarensis TaxID=2316362 RepID=A0A4Q2DNL1_9AGAR|nr:hypothetical protein EST38_g4911 [Candolleomyces aberdarensis]
MASTQWETVPYSSSIGPIREKVLIESWSEVLAQGAIYRRIVDPASDTSDANDIIDHILRKHVAATQIQKELVELGKQVAETEVAQNLIMRLESWLWDPQTKYLSQEKEEQLKEFPVDAGFVDRVKGLFRLKNDRDSPSDPPTKV